MFPDEINDELNKETTQKKPLMKKLFCSWWKIGLIILVLAALGVYVFLADLASPSVIATVQAESMILPTNATIINSASASGGKAVKLALTGTSLTGTFNLPSKATSMIIVAHGSNCSQGWPTMTVSIDNSSVINSISVNNNNWQNYIANVSLASSSHLLKITDLSKQSCRSLFIDDIIFYGSATVAPKPTISFSATPVSIATGASSTLTWNSTNVSSCAASGDWVGKEPTTGSYSTGALNSTQKYTLNCSGVSGNVAESVTVNVLPTAIATGNPTCQTLAVPIYNNSDLSSNTWYDTLPSILGVGIVIANPANGPGTAVNSAFLTTLENIKTVGTLIYGYVDTAYATNSIASVEATITNWKNLYGVTDIFFDNVSTGITGEPYYQTLTNYVHQQTTNSQTILNIGTVPDQSYMNAGDIIVSFEGNYATYQNVTFPSWVYKYSASRFYNIIYNVPSQAFVIDVLNQAETNNVSYIYVTNTTKPNLFNSLPSYISTEARSIQANCSQ